jgi:hypothetical protein
MYHQQLGGVSGFFLFSFLHCNAMSIPNVHADRINDNASGLLPQMKFITFDKNTSDSRIYYIGFVLPGKSRNWKPTHA